MQRCFSSLPFAVLTVVMAAVPVLHSRHQTLKATDQLVGFVADESELTADFTATTAAAAKTAEAASCFREVADYWVGHFDSLRVPRPSIRANHLRVLQASARYLAITLNRESKSFKLKAFTEIQLLQHLTALDVRLPNFVILLVTSESAVERGLQSSIGTKDLAARRFPLLQVFTKILLIRGCPATKYVGRDGQAILPELLKLVDLAAPRFEKAANQGTEWLPDQGPD